MKSFTESVREILESYWREKNKSWDTINCTSQEWSNRIKEMKQKHLTQLKSEIAKRLPKEKDTAYKEWGLGFDFRFIKGYNEAIAEIKKALEVEE